MEDNPAGLTDLSAVDNRSLVDKVEFILIDYLTRRKLKPGDTIPKEVELARSMGVSRTVIRESLNRLKTMGMIESVKHKGAVIKSPDLLELLKKSMIPCILGDSTLKDIFELRLALEIGMADLVFMRKSSSDITELYEIVSEEPESTEDVLFAVEHEVRFHGKLYEISGNRTMMNFQNLLLPVFNYVYATKIITRPKNRRHHVTHRQLVEILDKKSPEDFRNAMRWHLENHFMRLALTVKETSLAPEKV